MSNHLYRSLFRCIRRDLIVFSRFYSRDSIQLKSSYQFNFADRQDSKDFHLRPKQRDRIITGDADVFGTLTDRLEKESAIDEMPNEEGDVIKLNYYEGKIGKKRLSTKQYADLIKKFLSEKRLAEALNVLEERMIKEDRVQPENYIYNLLIDGCAKAGYTQKAFKLYNDMKKRALKVTGATYTSLFNACALSPLPGDGLRRARKLRELLVEKHVSLNISNYHSMMKAFGRCGDLVTAFSLVDEMISKGVRPTADTFCFLLQACISDQSNGFRHALLVWRKMREKRIQPTIYCYNLMLRSARDCGIEDLQHLFKDLKLLSPEMTQGTQLLLETKEVNIEDPFSTLPSLPGPSSIECCLPNLLSTTPQMGSVISISRISKPKHRLMLLGGSENFVQQMKLDGAEPDVKTATLLLDMTGGSTREEQELFDMLTNSGFKPDIDFCNMLIKKRCYRKDYFGARDVIGMISENKLVPNLMTFGVLSLSCRSMQEASRFLADLKAAGFRPNMEILGGLLYSARHTWNIRLIQLTMDLVLEEEIQVSLAFYNQLEKFKNFVSKQLQLKEEGLPYHKNLDSSVFMDSYQEFLIKFNFWSKAIDLDDRDNIHPWKQFKQPT